MSILPKHGPWPLIIKLAAAASIVLLCYVIAVRWSHLMGGLGLAVAIISWLMPRPWLALSADSTPHPSSSPRALEGGSHDG